MTPTRPALSVAQLAARLSCSPQTVRKLLVSGAIPYFWVGRCWRINQGDVDLWLIDPDYWAPMPA